MRRHFFSNFRFVGLVGAIACLCAATAQAGARGPDLKKYPLRVHVLASDETHKAPRMSPGEAVACDDIGGTLDSISPGGGGWGSVSGVSGDPCSENAQLLMARLMSLGDDAPVFAGAGRGDLVTPPGGTQAISFQYADCQRVRVRPGFDSLPARWKVAGKKLEVLMPSDSIPRAGKPLMPSKCSLNVTLHDYVYLLLRNGRIVEVSEDAYWKRPALRMFLSGVVPQVQPRTVQDYTVPAYPGKK